MGFRLETNSVQLLGPLHINVIVFLQPRPAIGKYEFTGRIIFPKPGGRLPPGRIVFILFKVYTGILSSISSMIDKDIGKVIVFTKACGYDYNFKPVFLKN